MGCPGRTDVEKQLLEAEKGFFSECFSSSSLLICQRWNSNCSNQPDCDIRVPKCSQHNISTVLTVFIFAARLFYNSMPRQKRDNKACPDHIREGHAGNSKIWTHTSTCPICGKVFRSGYYHPADQKLYSHMHHGKSHKRCARKMNWKSERWPYV